MKYVSGTGCFLALVTAAAAADWPCWRGPQRSGISKETGWSDRWPEGGPPVLWKASVGTGFSSVAVAGGRLYTAGNADNRDTVWCFDADTGKKLWSHSYDADLGERFFEGGPTATPAADGDAVYTLSRWGDLFCLDAATGKVRWSRNLQEEEGMPVPSWGFAGSPVVHEDLLLLNVGRAGMAVEKATGKTVWASAKEESGYSTPVLFRRGGNWYALFSSGNAFTAAEARTGKLLWEHEWITRYGVNAADPIVSGEFVFLSSGYNKGCTLLKMEGDSVTEVWRNRNLRNQMNPSVLLGGYLYGFDGDTAARASLRCVELKTGAVRWADEEVGLGSLMAADGKLIVLTADGELMVGKATPEGELFQPAAKAKVLEGKCWTVPVLANGRIYCRNAEGDLVCVDVRGEGE